MRYDSCVPKITFSFLGRRYAVVGRHITITRPNLGKRGWYRWIVKLVTKHKMVAEVSAAEVPNGRRWEKFTSLRSIIEQTAECENGIRAWLGAVQPRWTRTAHKLWDYVRRFARKFFGRSNLMRIFLVHLPLLWLNNTYQFKVALRLLPFGRN